MVTLPAGVAPGGGDAATTAPDASRTEPAPLLLPSHSASRKLVSPMKLATKRFGRVIVNIARRPDLQDPAAAHHRDAVRHGQRLFLVVRHEHEGDAGLVLQPLELDLHLLAQLEVERRQRLVQQQHLRPRRQRPRQRHPLLLAARELAGCAGS